MQENVKIGFIGAGSMTSCLLGGWLDAGYQKEQFIVNDHKEVNCERLRNQWFVEATTDAEFVINNVDILIIAVKPQSFFEFFSQFGKAITNAGPLVVSIAAGITTDKIADLLGNPEAHIIRAMPNTAVRFRAGATGLIAGKTVLEEERHLVEHLFKDVSEIVFLKDEAQMDALSALSGSGPAYFFYIMEALIEAAQKHGLPLEDAKNLIIATMQGSAILARLSNVSLAELRNNVTSKGGMTEQGLKVLREQKCDEILKQALNASIKHAKVLRDALELKPK